MEYYPSAHHTLPKTKDDAAEENTEIIDPAQREKNHIESFKNLLSKKEIEDAIQKKAEEKALKLDRKTRETIERINPKKIREDAIKAYINQESSFTRDIMPENADCELKCAVPQSPYYQAIQDIIQTDPLIKEVKIGFFSDKLIIKLNPIEQLATPDTQNTKAASEILLWQKITQIFSKFFNRTVSSSQTDTLEDQLRIEFQKHAGEVIDHLKQLEIPQETIGKFKQIAENQTAYFPQKWSMPASLFYEQLEGVYVN